MAPQLVQDGHLRRSVICLLMAIFAVLALLFTWTPHQLPDVIRQMLLPQRIASSIPRPSQPQTESDVGNPNNISISLHPDDHVYRDSRRLEYFWTITSEPRRPDGVLKHVYLINNQFPGPLIEARSGDTLVIQVENGLKDDEGLSIHWHGLHQRGFLGMDGAVGYTQRAISAGASMTYEFKISEEQHGTFWYHAHDQVQRGDGLYGGLVVHKPAIDATSESTKYEYEREELLMIGDWYHRQAEDVMAWYQTVDSFGNEPVPDSLLLNGKGAYNCSLGVVARPIDCFQQAETDIPFLAVPRPGSYRYRIINTGSLAGVSLDFGHAKVKAFQIDGGHDILSDPAQQVGILYPGERLDVVVTWSSEASAIKITLDDESFRYSNAALETQHYLPVAMAGQTFLSMPTADDIVAIDLANVSSIASPEVPAQADLTMVIYVTSVKLAHLDNIPTGFINHTTWKPSSEPLISLPRADWDEYQFAPFIPLVDGSKALWVDVVINNLDDGAHPFHLHGHDFYVLHSHKGGSYWGSYNPFEDAEMIGGGEYNTETPMRKDTFSVPSRGFTVIRFRADNPGIWLFHCHVMWHMGSGMAMGFHIGEDEAHIR